MSDSGAPRARRRTLGRAAITLFTFQLVAASLFVLAPAARACEPTDPSCLVDKAKETVDDVQHTVDQTKETVEETVDPVVHEAQDAVKDTGDTVKDTVDDAVGPPKENPGDPGPSAGGPGTEPGSSSPQPGVKGKDVTREGTAAKTHGRKKNSPGSRGARTRGSAPAPGRSAETTVGPASIGPTAQSGTTPDPQGAAEIARQFVFPLILSAAVAAFLMIEGRIDRRDPKLLLAPLDSEMLSFE